MQSGLPSPLTATGQPKGVARYFKTLSCSTLLEPPEGPWKEPVHTSQLNGECISVHTNHVRIKHHMYRCCSNSSVCIHILISCFASFDSPASGLCFSFEVSSAYLRHLVLYPAFACITVIRRNHKDLCMPLHFVFRFLGSAAHSHRFGSRASALTLRIFLSLRLSHAYAETHKCWRWHQTMGRGHPWQMAPLPTLA